MKHISIHTAISAAIITLLAACGGGGGDGPNTQPNNTISGGNTTTPINNTHPAWNAQLSVNQNRHLFNNENTFLVKPPAARWQPEINKVVQLTNQLRRNNGAAALTLDTSLSAHAQRRAEELAGLFEHTRPDGKPFSDGARYGFIGENLAFGYTTAEGSVTGWENSPGHKQNMLEPDYTKIGVGIIALPGSHGGYYWVQIFGDNNTSSNYTFDQSTTAREQRLDGVTAPLRSFADKNHRYTSLNVDGVQIQLGSPARQGIWENFNRNNHSGTVNGYNDVRFGTVRAGSGSHKVFYTGRHTDFADMPTSGSAQYVGKAVMVNGQTVNNRLDAQFQADFGSKELHGVLSENGRRLVDINARIRGAAFHSPHNAPVETQGAFFGAQAKELGGVFHDRNSGGYGAFGAQR